MNPSPVMTRVRGGRGPLFFGPGRVTREIVRTVPGVAVVVTLALLARGGFQTLATSRWAEIVASALLLLGVAVSGLRRVRRGSSGAPSTLRDELEFGGGLLAAANVVVALLGPAVFPLVYLLMAFLVTLLSRPAGLTLLGAAILFDALDTLPRSPTTFAAHTGFLLVFAAMYHVVLSA